MKKYLLNLILLLTLYSSYGYCEDNSYVVIVHPDNLEALSIDLIRSVYHGRRYFSKSDKKYLPLVLPKNNPIHGSFSAQFMKRTSAQLNSLWAKLLFTGKGSAPKQVTSILEMKMMVSTHQEYIGYVPISEIDSSVRAIYEFPPITSL